MCNRLLPSSGGSVNIAVGHCPYFRVARHQGKDHFNYRHNTMRFLDAGLLVVFIIPPLVYTFKLANLNRFADYNIVFGCYSYRNMLDCSNLDFINLPRFSQWTKMSTMVLFLRNMKYLDLTSMDLLEWPNLSQIYLNGNFFLFIMFNLKKRNFIFLIIFLF